MSHNGQFVARFMCAWEIALWLWTNCQGTDSGLLPCRLQAIILTNVGILLIGPLGLNFSEILIEIHIFSFKKMHLKMSSGKWRPFCLGLNALNVRHGNLSFLVTAYSYMCTFRHGVKWPDCFPNRVLGNVCSKHRDFTVSLSHQNLATHFIK